MGIVVKSKETNQVFKEKDYRIVHLNLQNQKLTNARAITIINNLTEDIVTVDLSWNPGLGVSAYSHLGEKINSTFYKLKKATFDHNNIIPRGLEALCDGIVYSNSLTVLNLNHNNLENEHAIVLADFLKDSSLRMLFIAWNKIRDKGAVSLFNSMKDNQFLQVFDGSFNSFSSTSLKSYGNVNLHNDDREEILLC